MRQLKAQESAHLKIRNEQLETEIEEKEAELFTQTSFIIHKNELILKLKEIVDEISSRNTQKALQPLYQKINVLLANNLDTEEDWKIFLIKFEQKHRNFFKHLKELYPQLTNNDLRLCACLKLNMGNYAKVEELTDDIIKNGKFSLYPDFYQLFKIPGKLCDESIFECQMTDFGNGSGDLIDGDQWFVCQGPSNSGNISGWGDCGILKSFRDWAYARGETIRATTSFLMVHTPIGCMETPAKSSLSVRKTTEEIW